MSKKILVTHPGKIGDLLWACATIRLIAERAGEPVTLLVPPALAGVGELLKLQSYIEDVVVDKWWEVQDTAPASPRTPDMLGPTELAHYRKGTFAKVIHLGYTQWPKSQLAKEAYYLACVEGELNPLDLERPWIAAPTPQQAGDTHLNSAGEPLELSEVSVGFTDEWVELKAGILLSCSGRVGYTEDDTSFCATDHLPSFETVDYEVLCAKGSRWDKEYSLLGASGCENIHVWPGGWVEAAYIISRSKVFLGCLSSLAVLAKALGKPRVLVEPNPHRHHEIFQHPDCPLVTGNDGKPTHDARHVAEALREKLGRAR